jgi:hypothetical protein
MKRTTATGSRMSMIGNLMLSSLIADRVYSFGKFDGTETWSYYDATDKTKGVKATLTNGGM